VRDNPSARDLAAWANELQELAEESEFGIPVVLASNPRNHVKAGATMGIGEGGGVFSEWPGELGFGATMDPDLVREFAEIARREWRAAGLHKMYGYMADVPSEPRWTRFDGTLGEDPQLVAASMTALVRGFQGEALGPDSVALTVKHFPGGGVRTDGHDPHFPWGKDNEYPTAGALETYQLPPFVAAIDAGVASVMPYYSRPVNSSAPQLPKALWQSGDEQFEEVAFAYNRAIITGLLRDRLGFAGYVNTDSGILETMAYGVEELTPEERWARAIRAGSDVVSDVSDPSALIAAVRAGVLDEHELDGPVVRLLAEMFALGLFENPYVDPEVAQSVAGDSSTRARGDEAQRRSVTLLRNDRGALPPRPGSRVYVEVLARRGAADLTAALRRAVADRFGNGALVDDPEDADVAMLWLRPELSLFGGDDRPDAPLSLDPAELGIDVTRVQRIEGTVPTVVAVNLSNPWLLAEIEPAAAAVLATYEISPVNLAAVLVPVHRARRVDVGIVQHPYTQRLLLASPVPDPDRQEQRRANRRRLLEQQREQDLQAGAAA
jgi:beta-glucosidase